jgi:hypothetical protein
MIRLRNLLNETHMKQSHINLMRVSTNLEKVLPELTKAQATKLTEMMTEISVAVSALNTLPYTVFNADAWDVYILAATHAVGALKEEVVKISEKKESVNCASLIKALDEVFSY